MKLSRFIGSDMEELLEEWELFARSLPIPGAAISKTDLRDHARQMLEAIVRDMDGIKSAAQRKKKSTSDVSEIAGAQTAASTYGSLRHLASFS